MSDVAAIQKSVASIQIRNLFGYLNHSITFYDNNPVFIHGPNGCGKTTILNLLEALFSFDLGRLLKINVQEMHVQFSDNTKIAITWERNRVASIEKGIYRENTIVRSRRRSTNDMLIISLSSPDYNTETSYVLKYDQEMDLYLRRHFEKRNHISFYSNKNEIILDEIPDDYFIFRDAYSQINEGEIDKEKKEEHREAYDRIYKTLKSFNVKYIDTQRLILNKKHRNRDSENEDAASEAIIKCAESLQQMISSKISSQASISQELDSSFPARLLKIDNSSEISLEFIKKRMSANDGNIQELIEVGLYTKQSNIVLDDKSINDMNLRVINLYLEDMENKLKVFDDLRMRIRTFLSTLSSRFKNKTITVDRDKGIKIRLNNQEKGLPLSGLSSGEKHLFILFYELIFNTKPGTLILIDEPEISLHVDWQRRFVDQLIEAKELNNCQLLIATHAPQIIGEHLDWAQGLSGGILDEG